MLHNPLHAIIYISFILISCSLISRYWVDMGGSSAKEVANNLKNQNITAYGGTEKLLEKKLKRNINIAAYFGGFCIGALTLLADFLGTIGSGTGILLTSGIIYELFEEVKRSQKQGHTLW
jgi:protein transport protein SEC61 subunit alpha